LTFLTHDARHLTHWCFKYLLQGGQGQTTTDDWDRQRHVCAGFCQ